MTNYILFQPQFTSWLHFVRCIVHMFVPSPVFGNFPWHVIPQAGECTPAMIWWSLHRTHEYEKLPYTVWLIKICLVCSDWHKFSRVSGKRCLFHFLWPNHGNDRVWNLLQAKQMPILWAMPPSWLLNQMFGLSWSTCDLTEHTCSCLTLALFANVVNTYVVRVQYILDFSSYKS